ncbi:glycosyl hydrolase family protein [Artemisia annua]|uniref:Glycosyl hydrolase family protein n=1 Tax=Artemisia annua TaxID=35608 RepID=A0A2U1PI97_ARTAN|nr:glycosyl hydrolase family protein [Artemisia annua]
MEDPTSTELDCLFTNLHERFGINIKEDDPMDKRVRSIYDSVIYKFRKDKDYATRLVELEVSKALDISISTTTKIPRSNTAPLVPYFNNDLEYMLKGPKEHQPSTMEVATFEEIPQPFLEEERFLDIFSEEEVDREKYNTDAYLGIINVSERSRGYYHLKHLRSKSREKVFVSVPLTKWIILTTARMFIPSSKVKYRVIRKALSFNCVRFYLIPSSSIILIDLCVKTCKDSIKYMNTNDCDAIATIYEYQNLTKSPEDVVPIALQAGTDINCGTYPLRHTKSAVDNGQNDNKFQPLQKHDVLSLAVWRSQSRWKATSDLVSRVFYKCSSEQHDREISEDNIYVFGSLRTKADSRLKQKRSFSSYLYVDELDG